jgi:hypothetical protein
MVKMVVVKLVWGWDLNTTFTVERLDRRLHMRLARKRGDDLQLPHLLTLAFGRPKAESYQRSAIHYWNLALGHCGVEAQ